MEEQWKDIEGYEGYYQVSNLGRVKSLDRYIDNKGRRQFIRGVNLKPGKDRGGYSYVILQKNSKKTILLHKLVAQAFLTNPYNKPQINHIDGNKQNNCVDNLEYCTPSENVRHAIKIGLANNNKPIVMISPNGKILKRFESAAEAQRFFNKDRNGNILNCLHGRSKTAYGYKWKYVYEINN